MSQIPDHCGDVGPGWGGILEALHQRLKLIDKSYTVNKVFTDEFGILRVYLVNETPEMWQCITDAEDRSRHTCEECGSGARNFNSGSGGWMTRCRTHDPHIEREELW